MKLKSSHELTSELDDARALQAFAKEINASQCTHAMIADYIRHTEGAIQLALRRECVLNRNVERSKRPFRTVG